MAEQVESCRRKDEIRGDLDTDKIAIDAEEKNVSLLDSSRKSPNKTRGEITPGVSTDHAQNLLAVDESFCEGNVTGQDLSTERDAITLKKRSDNEKPLICVSNDGADRINTFGEVEINRGVTGDNVFSNEDLSNETKDARRMNNQCNVDADNEGKNIRAAINKVASYESKSLTNDKGPQKDIECAAQKGPERQNSNVIINIVEKPSEETTRRKDLLNSKNEQSNNLTSSLGRNRIDALEEENYDKIKEKKSEGEQDLQFERRDNVIEDLQNMSATGLKKKEWNDNGEYGIGIDIGGKSPTFDKVDGHGAKTIGNIRPSQKGCNEKQKSGDKCSEMSQEKDSVALLEDKEDKKEKAAQRKIEFNDVFLTEKGGENKGKNETNIDMMEERRLEEKNVKNLGEVINTEVCNKRIDIKDESESKGKENVDNKDDYKGSVNDEDIVVERDAGKVWENTKSKDPNKNDGECEENMDLGNGNAEKMNLDDGKCNEGKHKGRKDGENTEKCKEILDAKNDGKSRGRIMENTTAEYDDESEIEAGLKTNFADDQKNSDICEGNLDAEGIKRENIDSKDDCKEKMDGECDIEMTEKDKERIEAKNDNEEDMDGEDDNNVSEKDKERIEAKNVIEEDMDGEDDKKVSEKDKERIEAKNVNEEDMGGEDDNMVSKKDKERIEAKNDYEEDMDGEDDKKVSEKDKERIEAKNVNEEDMDGEDDNMASRKDKERIEAKNVNEEDMDGEDDNNVSEKDKERVSRKDDKEDLVGSDDIKSVRNVKEKMKTEDSYKNDDGRSTGYICKDEKTPIISGDTFNRDTKEVTKQEKRNMKCSWTTENNISASENESCLGKMEMYDGAEKIEDCDKHETPSNGNQVNGENGTQKSDSSMEDSASDSEAGFTKRASNDPNFATVYSFLSLFGHLLNLPEFSIDDFEQCLENCTDLSLQTESNALLETLHLKLLRRLSRSCHSQFSSLGQVSNDRLVKYLIRFSKNVDLDLAWDLEKFGYHVLGSAERLALLKALCEIQFDENPRFKIHFTDEYIKTDNYEALRLQPEGHDIQGKAIWYQQDKFAGFRVYSVEEGDELGKSWKLLASTLEELDNLVDSLKKKSEVNPKDVALMKRKERKEKRLALEQTQKHSKKRRGKLRVTRKNKGHSESESDEEDENPCAHCFSNKRPDMVLLCDTCDAAYHTLCLRPPLMTIPEGDWICPFCQQLELIEKLQDKYKTITARKKQLERVSKRTVFDDVKISNIMEGDDDSRRSGRQRSKIDYNFTNYYEMMNEAISNEPKPSNQPKSEISAENFYCRSGRRKARRLNDLDGESFESESSEYENSDTEKEPRKSSSKLTRDSVARGCRRSRRLKRKHGDDEKSESSESEEEHFVRRSTRSRKSAHKTYMDYESDDTPEEVILHKKPRQIDDSDEYVVSGSEEDPEDVMLPRRSRKIVSDEDDDEETPECDDDETDVDEEICEDFERNVVSDDEEEDEEVTQSDDEEDTGTDNADYSTDDDDDDDDGDYGDSKKKRSEEKHVKKRGGKDIRNIMKSLREEKEASPKYSAKKEEKDSSKNKLLDSVPGKKVAEADTQERQIDKEAEADKKPLEVAGKSLDDNTVKVTGEKACSEALKVEDKGLVDAEMRDELLDKENENEGERKDKEIVTSESTSVKTVNIGRETSGDVAKDTQEPTVSTKDMRTRELRESGVKPTSEAIGNHLTEESPIPKRQREPNFKADGNDIDAFVRKEMMSLPLKDHPPQDEKRCGQVKMETFARDFLPFQQSSNLNPIQQDPLKATIALSSFNPSMTYPHAQPPFHQAASPVIPMQHQQEILRPRPYTADAMRQYDAYQQTNSANYSPVHSAYHLRPNYGNFIDQTPMFQPNMHGYPRMAPPQYPAYSPNEQQAMWGTPRYHPSMQWNYPPYRDMSPQSETKQRAPQMHRPYLDMQTYDEKPSSGTAMTKSQNRANSSHSNAESARRSKTTATPADARKPSVSESYAAFRNMVIGSTTESSHKKAKRS